MKNLTIYFFGLLLIVSCKQTSRITHNDIENISLIQVDHPYIGGRVDSFKLENKLVADFLKDFADKKEEISKFYSCYVIKIHLKNGQFISYRTNGQLFEKFQDDGTSAVYFKLNKNINLVSKYWEIQPENFCKAKQADSNRVQP